LRREYQFAIDAFLKSSTFRAFVMKPLTKREIVRATRQVFDA